MPETKSSHTQRRYKMADFKTAAVFSDNCVFQRDKETAVFGTGEEGSAIKAVFTRPCGCTLSAETTVKDGRWLLYLPAQEACDGGILTVTSGEKSITFTGIAVGEVWLLGGQSNMEFELQNCTTGAEHLKNDNPNVRFYYTPKNAWYDEQFYADEAASHWKKFSSEDAKDWSAAGYIFGKKLSEKLGVTVGLIGCNWGGTSASAWMSREALSEDPDTKTYLDEFDEGIKGKTVEEQVREYLEYKEREAVWNKKCEEIYTANPNADWGEVQKEIGVCEWPGPINCRNPYRPEGLYEFMLKRVMPYSLKGWLFYQGESDDHKPGFYYKLFKRMIKQWRDDWKDETMPMVFTQLPGLIYETEADRKHWCLIREAQQRIADEDPYSSMACIIECGLKNDIHPKDKEPVGDRLYRAALCDVYKLSSRDEDLSPSFESVEFKNGAAVVTLKDAGAGLEVRGSRITGFELAGADKEFVPADADILARGRIKVTAAAVPEPAYVRYLWTNYPEEVTLYSETGLPVAPFRSSMNDQEDVKVQDSEMHQQLEL